MSTACGAETYQVAIDSLEAHEGILALQVDASEGDPVLRASLQLKSQRDDACPVLSEDATVVVEREGVRAELQIESRGDGFTGVDCALKCHDLVALEAVCTPIAASLRGDEIQTLIGAGGDARILFEDASGSLGVTLDSDAIAPRTIELPGGSSIVADQSLPTEYRFTSVPFEWSHDDTDHWVSEWADHPAGTRDGNFSAFNLRPPRGTEPLAFSIRGDVSEGLHSVYVAASAPPAHCDVALCRGVEHLVRLELTVTYP